MSFLDLFIALFVVLAVLRGVRTGFLAGVFSLVGMVVGAALGSRLAPFLMPESESTMFRAGITLASIVAFAVLGELLARAVGGSLRSRLRNTASEALDRFGGGTLGLALSLMFVWVIGIFALQAPPLSGFHPTIDDSRILQALNQRMPSPWLTEAVATLDPLPQMRVPRNNVAEPDKAILQDPEVLAAGSQTVRITGIACGYGVEGSGWIAAPNLVVTNAHVVAGESITRIQTRGAESLRRGRVVLFDKKNDVAILRVRGLGAVPLPLAEPVPGEPVAVLGYPENGPLDIRPARTGETRRVISSDAYNEGPVERTVTGLRAYVRPGNSGGPVVNADGEVVATVFASRANSENSGYGIPSQLVRQHLNGATGRKGAVSTGACVNSN